MKEIYESLKNLNDSMEISETIKKEGDEFVLYTKDGSRVLGRHKTREDAVKQEQAIEISKHSG